MHAEKGIYGEIFYFQVCHLVFLKIQSPPTSPLFYRGNKIPQKKAQSSKRVDSLSLLKQNSLGNGPRKKK